MKITSTGQSLIDLYKIYGEGSNGFYSFWWKDEVFANDKPEAGEYEVNIEKKELENLTYHEQVKKLEKGYEVPHPAIFMQALLEYHKKTGEYAMKNWYSRTSLLDSDGHRVGVGYCDAGGVRVVSAWDDDRGDGVGLYASRKLKKSLDTGSLESFESSPLEFRVAKLEAIVQKLKDALYDND